MTTFSPTPLSLQRAEQAQKMKQQFQNVCPNYAYELLLLQIKINEQSQKKGYEDLSKPTIEEITRLIELYMIAVQNLESASDKRFHYFNKKIQSVMMKKNIVEQLHLASTGNKPNKSILVEANKLEMNIKKQEHEMYMYYNQEQIDIKKIQEMLKKSDLQVDIYEGKIKNNLTHQQKKLQQRIRQRKMRSESGSVKGNSLNKFKSGTKVDKNGFNIVKPSKIQQKKIKQQDIRMEYFVDCNDNEFKDSKIKTPPKKRSSGSVQKFLQSTKQKFGGYSNRFI